MEEAPRRPLMWLLAIALAVAAFLYVAVYDVTRVNHSGPSLSGEEFLILARHGALERGATVSCDDRGQVVTGQVVGLPGELAVANAGGVHVAKRAQDRLGAPLERLSVSRPLATTEEPSVQIAADPGHLLISSQDGSSTPRPVRASSCLPVAGRVKVASLLGRQ